MRNKNTRDIGKNTREAGRVSLNRAFSKLGICSRTQAEQFIRDGRVRVNGRAVTDPAFWVDLKADRIQLDDAVLKANDKVYLALNKPRGVVTTRHDPEGRPTVFDSLRNIDVSFVAPVGRLDKASEGLLLFTNDTILAQRLLDPATGIRKVYHVQVSGTPDDQELQRMTDGILSDGALLTAAAARMLRHGEKNAWLEIELTEGKNREIRRMLEVLGRECLRLVRISIQNVTLGDLAKGEFRYLTDDEVRSLRVDAGLK